MRARACMVLGAGFLLGSCTSLHRLSTDERLDVLRAGTADVEITLTGGSVMRLEGGRYLLVTEPGSYWYGTGLRIDYRTGREGEFRGKIEPVKIFGDTLGRAGKIVCWRNDTLAVRFRPGDYVRVTPGAGTGLYVFGVDRPVRLTEIGAVREEEFDAAKSVLATAGGIAGGMIVMTGFLLASIWFLTSN